MTPPGNGPPRCSGELGIDAANARRADLTVKVAKKEKEERVFDCWISSPLIPGLEEPCLEEWVLPEGAEKVVKDCMAEFENHNTDPGDRLLALNGAGQELWEIAPKVLGWALDEIAREGKEIGTVQITSDEGSIPWELMLPDDGDPRPLGVRYTIARWFIGPDPLRDTGRPAADARVGLSSDGSPAKAKDEAELVYELLKGDQLNTTSATAIRTDLEAWTGTVLHFVCHGAAERLFLGETTTLTARQVAGMRERVRPGWQKSAPIVFLNACKGGQTVPTLIGPGGLSRSWTRVGAGAVIAPLWSVRDEIAHLVATEFYERITNEPETPYAEIVRDIRAKAEDKQEDSYAAYCYFGSPWACAGRAGAVDWRQA